jgi:hypothetical protein
MLSARSAGSIRMPARFLAAMVGPPVGRRGWRAPGRWITKNQEAAEASGKTLPGPLHLKG